MIERIVRKLNNAATRAMPGRWVRAHGSAPVASITFDDFPKSAWTVGGAILAEYGAKGAYYTAGRFCGLHEDGIDYFDEEDLQAVRAAGHEIACHSFSHQKAPRVGSSALVADAERNAAFLRERLGDLPLASYAYPYGEVSPRSKALLGGRFASARGIRKGVNGRTIDLAQLRAIPLEHRRWRPDEIDAAVAAARETNGWVIFFTHDIAEAPSPYGATPAMLRYTMDRLAEAGVEVLPVRHAMAKTVFGEAA